MEIKTLVVYGLGSKGIDNLSKFLKSGSKNYEYPTDCKWYARLDIRGCDKFNIEATKKCLKVMGLKYNECTIEYNKEKQY